MITDIKDYLKYYLGQKAQVKVNYPGNSILVGRICEITKDSNHGNWVEVWFQSVVTVHRAHFNYDGLNSNSHHFFIGEDEIKPILRRIESLTEDEIFGIALARGLTDAKLIRASYEGAFFQIQFYQYGNDHFEHWFKHHMTAPEFHYLLSLGIWIFGNDAFDNGLIIDATTIKTESNG